MKKLLFVLFVFSISVFSKAGTVTIETGGGCPSFVNVEIGNESNTNTYERKINLCQIISISSKQSNNLYSVITTGYASNQFRNAIPETYLITEDSYNIVLTYLPMAKIVNESNE